MRQQLADLNFARSVKRLLLVRAGAVPRLLSLVQASPNAVVRSGALSALTLIVSGSEERAAKSSAELIAAGAVPTLLQQAGSNSGSGRVTLEQHTAMDLLVSLATHSTEHHVALQSWLMPILVDWLRTDQDDIGVSLTVAALGAQVRNSTAACQAAIKAGAVAALQQLSHPHWLTETLHHTVERLQAFDPD